jgi:hypothetical protein
MKKLTLNVEALQVQTFATAEDRVIVSGTVRAFAKPTSLQDTDCSAIDACASARGCTEIDCPTYDPATCESADDACPSGRGCTSLFPC